MKTHWLKIFIIPLLILMLNACSSLTPPIELAPNGEIVKKAIALQLKQTETALSESLMASSPQFDLNQIKVKNIDPLFIAHLATYHLQGTYNLKLKLPRQKVTQQSNPFDIYLQRQVEGKTWRLLRRDLHDDDAQPQWTSYLIEP
ncbi:hypothetical protein C7H19_13640 [Aphanothece hegewaldii CCALA 016]|uniref:DUF4101 domain-containing protein n=1 Tax=Aphanothece hegewaldii CCALA 016 TaxID=2107694 RepID=A0A2T1LWF4_9CHRO|nr:hypothetical protein [Aphanothece hegewaldii]PSF36245.1 hypothetical protein C7H19_13640 [Aphanothece hegewaldii CCALA 016]